MKLPKYLNDFTNHIILTDQEIFNSSEIAIKNNQLTLDGELVFLLYLKNYNKELTININQDSKISLYIIYNFSKKSELDLKINLGNNSNVKLFSNFGSSRTTKFKLRENLHLQKNVKIEIADFLLFNGDLDLQQLTFLEGENAEIKISSLVIGQKQYKSKVKQEIFHQEKATVSDVSNNLITLEEAKLDYQVIGKIDKGREFSKCSQKNKGLMLSEHSEIACEPTLLIDEYNVEASHGAAIGKMDDLQLFYLLSRGLSETEAKALILSGYINPFINLIENDKLKKTVLTKINRTLRRA